MSKIISIGTAVPVHPHRQADILHFMQRVFALDAAENRKLKFLYHQSGIDTRYSVIPDYSREISAWKFYPRTENLEPFPSLEKRMLWYEKYAAPLSADAIINCLTGLSQAYKITHLITVSCTGMSAPGLDLQILDRMKLPGNIYRTSINFMGCYAAIHALKIADAICRNDPTARVMIVCTELCTLHFQREATADNMTSSLLFADGAAAVLVTGEQDPHPGLQLNGFYSEVISKGKSEMSWQLSSSGFLMTLSGYVPDLIEEDFEPLVSRACSHLQTAKEKITHWCMHPGGKRILESIHRSLQFHNGELKEAYDVLRQYGNMSSASILFVLKNQWQQIKEDKSRDAAVFGAAFGPGLTMETFVASLHA